MHGWVALLIVRAVVLVSMAQGAPSASHSQLANHKCPEGTVPSRKWNVTEVGAMSLSLKSTKAILDLDFDKDGFVTATVGQRGGPVAAPLWRWKVDKEGALRIVEDGPERTLWYRFRKLCGGDGLLVAEYHGARFEFVVKRKPRALTDAEPSSKP